MLVPVLLFTLPIVLYFRQSINIVLTFIRSCFISPLSHSNLQDRLDSFYSSQASIYDVTRSRLLRGRRTMLKLSAAELETLKEKRGELVWVDVGGGTGWNIEQMDEYFAIKNFKAVYLIDLCLPLLQVAEKRFKERGWTNVHILHQDATTFTLPGQDMEGKVDLFTMSYSLSMIPSPFFFAVLDRIDRFLDPWTGIFGVCDFYVSGSSSPATNSKGPSEEKRYVNWFSRVFWLHWFEFDHIDLHPSRREYLEFKFDRRKGVNGRNKFVVPWVVRIPYYVWLGTSRKRLEGQNSPIAQSDALSSSSSFDLNEASTPTSVDLNIPDGFNTVSVSSCYKEELVSKWRLPYVDHSLHKEFRTWIYGFTWEDPVVDMKAFGPLSKEDKVLAITSAGDNLLHYAIESEASVIHAVDMNPSQGHLLELKLACSVALKYEDFWKMFGEGKHVRFEHLLDRYLSPHLSPMAYAFWKRKASSFQSSFYLRGYSGWALRLTKWAFLLCGAQSTVKKICETKDLKVQIDLWDWWLKPILTSSLMKIVVGNPIFMWNALGVPRKQAQMLLSETNILQYVVDTLDPVVRDTLISQCNYHYLLTLQHHYSPSCCPLYLTQSGFERLRTRNQAFKVHTQSFDEVFEKLGAAGEELTVVVLLDAMDWYEREDTLVGTIERLKKSLKGGGGGRVFFRSAAMRPWYVRTFEKNGFKVENVATRDVGKGKLIDNVNMYASFWKATKL